MDADRQITVDGEPATDADLTCLALINYGAYTSFRVEDGGVHGLDLHLARLEASAAELFGEAVGEPRLRDLIRLAAADGDPCWLRVSLFSPEIRPREVSWRGRPRVMIARFPPPPPLAQSVRLQTQVHAREAAHLKHTATFGQIRARRSARDAGFDDALFVDDQGQVSEGTLWNIGFVRGDTVTWPMAPMLSGVGQALLQRGLDGVGLSSRTAPVSLSGLGGFDAAFICNSATPACAVSAIDDHILATAPALIDRLHEAWRSNPGQLI
ncbi:aminotransferase class IV [uncultured Brevundimonas sp.]|uniref:aminotransferase class IV n=1 Tax=uncultured Brevundimonas sp. TaxID=213418 RepID=UPI0030ED16ED|tara:strand:+ start:43361 stop:44164 length:804 start_codon:yes stop_codon:yes gene_type:complete